MAACDAHQFCDEDVRDFDELAREDTHEEVVDFAGLRRQPGGEEPPGAGEPRYSYMLSVPEGQVGLTPSGWPPAPVVVKHVVPRSPAAQVYAELGDEILAVNGQPVCDMDVATFDLNMRQRPLVIWMHRTKAQRMSL